MILASMLTDNAMSVSAVPKNQGADAHRDQGNIVGSRSFMGTIGAISMGIVAVLPLSSPVSRGGAVLVTGMRLRHQHVPMSNATETANENRLGLSVTPGAAATVTGWTSANVD